MTTTWIVVLAIGAATVATKALGPVLLGGRPLPPRIGGRVALLAPAVLASLVVTQAVGGVREYVVDERLAGLGAAALALALRAPMLVVVAVAAAVAALLRAV